MSRVRLSLSHRPNEDSPSCSPRLLLALCSIWTTSFISESVFVFSFSGRFLLFSSCYSLAYSRFRFGTYGPDKTQQFAAHRGDDLSFVFTLRRQSRVSLVQSVLCLPRNLRSLLRCTLLSFSQSSPDGRRAMITPCCFDDDPSQVSVACPGNAAAASSLATGIFAQHSPAITHQVREHL